MMAHTKKDPFKVLALITIFLVIAWTTNLQVSKASKILTVPDDYPTINNAVNQASPGDIILVKPGIYNENLLINKSLTLEGQNSASTIIIGSGGNQTEAVVTLAADQSKIFGFTIESVDYSNVSYYAYGIVVNGNNCTITRNNIHNSYIGIFCAVQSSTAITDNRITQNKKDGIRFLGGSLNIISDNSVTQNGQSGIAIDGYSNTVSGNIVQSNFRGIGLGTSNSVLFNNTLTSNNESGVFIAGSNNVISSNNISGNKYGVYVTRQLTAPRENLFYSNNFMDNFNNAYDDFSLPEYWDNGNQSGGNYWSDYASKYPNATQIDASGIGNTPYIIYSNNADNYPLINLVSTSNSTIPLASPPAATKQNSVIASWSFDTVDSNDVTPDSTGNNPAILGSVTSNYSYTPLQVSGKFGEALGFNGNSYANVHTSPSLEISGEVTIDAWISVQSIKGVPYNNILIEAVRTTAVLPTRTLGLAVNGETPQNATSPPTGALRGYVTTQNGVLNEIDTEQAVPLNQWTHVVFTRSETSGMHIYVNGQQQQVQVVSGVNNPVGAIEKPNLIYIGHDSITNIDELHLSNMVEQQGQSLWMQWWWLGAIIIVGAVSGLLFCFKKMFKF
jgi:parallel beta-helix repeat protein